jgi:hypothetical protein
VLRPYLTIPSPQNTGVDVTSVKIALGNDKVSLFVAYGRKTASPRSALGICCYEIPNPGPSPMPLSAPSARHDLDGRNVASSSLCESVDTKDGVHFVVVSSSVVLVERDSVTLVLFDFSRHSDHSLIVW